MADEASAGAGAGAGALPKLTYEEISDLNARKVRLSSSRVGWVCALCLRSFNGSFGNRIASLPVACDWFVRWVCPGNDQSRT